MMVKGFDHWMPSIAKMARLVDRGNCDLCSFTGTITCNTCMYEKYVQPEVDVDRAVDMVFQEDDGEID